MERWYSNLTKYRWKIYTSMFENLGKGRLLGLGCTEGSLTLQVAQEVEAEEILGIDLDHKALSQAKRKGILSIVSDLNQNFPLSDKSIDVVSADQIIEHLIDVDRFIEEIYRVLKPGGYAVICTENLSSIHNIFAILLGKQAFSQSISSKYYLGNPFSPHYKERHCSFSPHIHIFTIQGLKDICRVYGFTIEKVRGIGYFPLLPLPAGQFFERIDPIHAYFLAIRVKKLGTETEKC